jgi:hypothetical protein
VRYFRYDGDFRFTGRSGRIQVTIFDLQTGEKFMPVITNRNKAYSRFINYSKLVTSISQTGFMFECIFSDTGLAIKSAKIFLDKDEFISEYAEQLV